MDGVNKDKKNGLLVLRACSIKHMPFDRQFATLHAAGCRVYVVRAR
jgi:hypothetical protein